MRKFLLFLCSALLIGFSSCSSDDDNEDLSSHSNRKITKIEEYGTDGILYTSRNFTYDKNGRWVSYLWKDEEDGSRINNSSLSYSTDKITQIYFDDENDKTTTTYNLNSKGLIITENGYYYDRLEWIYKYKDGYLIGFNLFDANQNENITVDLEYTDGNLTRWTESTGQIYEFAYTDDENMNGIGAFARVKDFVFPEMSISPLVQQGYYGKSSKNILKSIKWMNSHGQWNYLDQYSYELDTDGYIVYRIKGRYKDKFCYE